MKEEVLKVHKTDDVLPPLEIPVLAIKDGYLCVMKRLADEFDEGGGHLWGEARRLREALISSFYESYEAPNTRKPPDVWWHFPVEACPREVDPKCLSVEGWDVCTFTQWATIKTARYPDGIFGRIDRMHQYSMGLAALDDNPEGDYDPINFNEITHICLGGLPGPGEI